MICTAFTGSNTLHICFLCHEYPPGRHGGVGSLTQTLARGLVDRGHAVTVVGCYDGPTQREDDRGVRVVRLARTRVPRGGFVLNGRQMRRALWAIHRARPIDVVEGPELSLALVPRGLPCRKLIRMNGGHHYFASTLGRRPSPWRSWLERRSFARATELCAVSQFVGEETARLLGLPVEAIEVIPNPVDTDHFRPRPDIREVDGRVVFAGTLCEKKGIRQLVQAMPAVLEHVPQVTLAVAGRDTSSAPGGGSFQRGLEASMSESVRSRVEFLGAVSQTDLPAVLAPATVCVYPSHMEAMPVAWLEALSMGKAVLGSDTGPGPEVIDHGRVGWLCDPHDATRIAEALIRLLTDPALRRRLGRAARARAIERYSRDRVVALTEAWYERCLRNGREKASMGNVAARTA